MNNNPIGIFDSGLGGLSVWREIRKGLPAESLIYYGDGLRCPYGDKPHEVVRGYMDEVMRWMVGRGVKMVVVACNTATAAAIDFLRAKYGDIPIVGMEPAVKPAAQTTRSKVIAILATEGSLHGELFRRTAERYGQGLTILPVVGEGFVDIVERGLESTPEAYEAVRRVVEPLIEQDADRLVLGCTHYPFLAEQIRKVIAGHDGVEIINPAPAVERRVAQLLDEYGIAAEAGHQAQYEFYTLAGDDYLDALQEKAARALEMDI